MRNIVKDLFDFQRFTANKHLSALITETESKYSRELSDDDLAFVNAAGDMSAAFHSSKKTGDARHD